MFFGAAEKQLLESFHYFLDKLMERKQKKLSNAGALNREVNMHARVDYDSVQRYVSIQTPAIESQETEAERKLAQIAKRIQDLYAQREEALSGFGNPSLGGLTFLQIQKIDEEIDRLKAREKDIKENGYTPSSCVIS